MKNTVKIKINDTARSQVGLVDTRRHLDLKDLSSEHRLKE